MLLDACGCPDDSSRVLHSSSWPPTPLVARRPSAHPAVASSDEWANLSDIWQSIYKLSPLSPSLLPLSLLPGLLCSLPPPLPSLRLQCDWK